jgi:hypothetical protein
MMAAGETAKGGAGARKVEGRPPLKLKVQKGLPVTVPPPASLTRARQIE